MAKKDLHPKWYPDAKVICNGEVVMTVGSTQPELRIDVWSGNHPFFTGEQRIIDSGGQVDRFMKRLDRYSSHKTKEADRQKESSKKKESRFERQQLVALDLSDRVAQLLNDNSIVTVGDLMKKLENEDELLALEGFGKKALEEVKTKLTDTREAFFAAE